MQMCLGGCARLWKARHKGKATPVISTLYFAPGLTPNPSPKGEGSRACVVDCGILAVSRKPCIAFPSNQSLVPKKRPRLRSGTGRFSRYCTSAPLGDRVRRPSGAEVIVSNEQPGPRAEPRGTNRGSTGSPTAEAPGLICAAFGQLQQHCVVNVVVDEDDGMLRPSNDVAEKGIGIEDLVFEEDAVSRKIICLKC